MSDRSSLFARAQLAWALAVGALWIGAVARLPFDIEYSAGELLDHVLSWRVTGVLYAPLGAPPYRVLNYPPLSLAVVRGLAAIGLSPLAAGRLFGTAGVLLALIVVYRWTRAVGLSQSMALGVAALGATSFPLLYSAGQFHIEGAAVAATAAGFWLVGRADRRTALAAGTCLAVACLVKQSEVPLTLAALVWTWRYDRRNAWRVTVAYAAVGALGCCAITLLFGAEAWRQMLTYTVGTYSIVQLGRLLVGHALPWAIFYAFALRQALSTHDSRRDARTWYLLAASAWLLSSARVGSGYPYFMDWQIAILSWLGSVIAERSRWNAHDAPAVRGRLLAGAFAVQIVIADVAVAGTLASYAADGHTRARQLAALCADIPAAPALTVAESPGLVRACGGVPALHPFIMANLAARGLWNDAPLARDLRAARYATVLLPFDPAAGPRGVDADRWTPGTIAAIRAGYAGTLAGGWWVGRGRTRVADRH